MILDAYKQGGIEGVFKELIDDGEDEEEPKP